MSWDSHNLTTVSSDAEFVEDCVAEERFWILRNPKAPRAHWQGLTRTSIKTITSLTVSLAPRHLICQKYEQKNFKIRLKLSLSATSLFTRAILMLWEHRYGRIIV